MSNVIGPEEAIAWLNTDDYDSTGYHVAVEHAIGALNKQVLMKPVIREIKTPEVRLSLDKKYYLEKIYEQVICPACAYPIGSNEDGFHQDRNSWEGFCKGCGQRVGESFEDNE